jgi:hypothetical protein
MPAPTQLIITGQPSNTIAGANITTAITVEIRDASGSLVETNTDNVTLAFGTDASAGAASLGGTLTVAAVAGVATFSDITIDKAFDNYTLAASSGVLTGATSSSFNITPAVKAKLGFSVEPSDATNIATVNPSIVVDVLDTYGNKTNDTDSITLSFANDASAGSGILSGTLTVAASGGSATFSDININYPATGYTLTVAAGGLISATSASFNITQVPIKLAVTQEPSNAQFNVAISPSIIVTIQDASSATVVGATDAVTLSFGTDPSSGSAVIGGTKTVNAVNGVAVFNDISIDTINNGYTFNFSSGSLTGTTSAAFNVFDTTLAFDSVATVNFGNISLGDSADATLLINHSGGSATTITETTLAPPFDFKNGAYPGTGGTCSATITTNCTIVLTYTPTTAITSNGTVTINYNGSNSTSRPLTGTGVSTTPTELSVFGPTGVITNSCIPYVVQSVDSNGDVGNVASNETVSLLINNGTGSFYSDSGCSSAISSTSIASGTSSTTIYFESATSAQSLTLIFNGTTLSNTSKAVTTSVEPTFISANLPNEIVTDTCTLAEVSLVDPNGVKTGSSTSKTINFTENGDVLVYTDSFCTNLVTSLNYAAYEGSKFIYLKNTTVEAVTFNFTDAGAVLTGDSSNVSFVSTLTWADTDYSKRVRIAINNLDIPDTFTNMPVLVKLDSSKINYADMLANGDDMRFYLDDHTTPLSYSIDTWDASGTSYIWVKVDSIAANSELNIYMYYSNGAATNNESSSTIWAAYEGVWLMNKSGATYVEETVNGRDGTANGSLTDIAGPVGNAVNFDGASTLKLTYDLAQVLGGTSTISFWMKTSQTGDDTDWKAPGLVGLSGTAANQDLFYSFINASGNIGSSAGGGTQVQSNFVVNDNTWRYISVSRNSTSGEFKFYINGVLNGSGISGTGLKTTSFYDFGATTKIWGGGGFYYYIGGMDSIRISNSVQTDNRVKAEYKFTTDTHVQFSSPEDL